MLTEQQQQAKDEILESVDAGRNHVLKGYAGTGKTYLCQDLAAELDNCAFVAPTNKAVRVLEEKIEGARCDTVHRLLKLKLKYGKLEQYDNPRLSWYDVIFVDECSMCAKELMGLLESNVPEGLPIIYVGDPAQLPPIGEISSQSFECPNQSMLTDIVRQAKENPIIPMSQQVRTDGFDPGRLWVDNKFIFERDRRYSFRIAEKFIQSGGVFAAWTNARVNVMNYYMHDFIYGEGEPDFCPGERIVMGQPYLAWEGDILANNGDEFTVVDVIGRDYEGRKCWFLKVEGVSQRFRVLQRSEMEAHNASLNKLKAKKMWREFFQLKEVFGDVRHTYAYTCHKLQGTTVKKIMIDVTDVMLNQKRSERNKCMYVAITRASEKVLFLT